MADMGVTDNRRDTEGYHEIFSIVFLETTCTLLDFPGEFCTGLAKMADKGVRDIRGFTDGYHGTFAFWNKNLKQSFRLFKSNLYTKEHGKIDNFSIIHQHSHHIWGEYLRVYLKLIILI